MESKTEGTMWKSMKNCVRDRCQKQRRAHSLSGCANLDSTPLLLGGTGVYRSPQSNYCSWSWNWVYLYRCGLGWNPLLSTPFSKSFFDRSDPFKLALTSHAARKNRGVACFSLLSMEERRKKERLLTSSVGLATYAFPHFPTKYNLENLLFKKLQR